MTDMKITKNCPSCDRPLPEGKTYCPACGFTVAIRCPHCSALSPKDSKKCAHCGTSLIEKRSPTAKKPKISKRQVKSKEKPDFGKIAKKLFAAISKAKLPRLKKPSFKRSKKEKLKKKKVVELTRGFRKYLILLICSLIFTQALRNSASHIFFLFVLFLPLALLLYTLTARRAIGVYMYSDSVTVEKYSPVKYEFCITNSFPLVYPFVEAIVSLPQKNSVRCAERTVSISLGSLTSYRADNTVSFPYRGTYEIGVKGFYVYDFFKLMRVWVDAESTSDIYVLPRRLNVPSERVDAVSDNAMKTVHSSVTYDRLEVSDIRDYRMGDPLKSIHWKLSSKSEDFIVKDHNTGTADMSFIFCDMSARINITKGEETDPAQELSAPEYYEDMNEYLADGVVELTVAEVLRELRQGRQVTLFWYDDRSSAGAFAYTLRGEDSLESIYKLFATAPLCSAEKKVSGLCAMANDTQNIRQIFVTAVLDRENLGGLCDAALVASTGLGGSAEVVLYDPEHRYKNKLEHKKYIEGCRARLAESGITLSEGRLPQAATGKGGEDR